jgi:hypothetical protein
MYKDFINDMHYFINLTQVIIICKLFLIDYWCLTLIQPRFSDIEDDNKLSHNKSCR